ncbi:PAS domain S-box protein, partial [bacterium]|nr:PAS domain S-box protein [bacterium]
GLQFLRELRENGNNIPFIIFTGKGKENVVIEALNLGANHYFNKHGDPAIVYAELIHGVKEVVKLSRAEGELEQIRWLLAKRVKLETEKNTQEQPYGNLAELNTRRKLLNALGEDMLTNIADEYLDLLGTSGAIYEKNGDYALGIFSSGWCRFLDQSSRKMCDTNDNREALKSGKWLCHESCWTEASKISIQTGDLVDIECNGGLHIFAAPIWAGKEIVGSMNFGYGNPPKDPHKLQEISKKYRVSLDELLLHVTSYRSIPSYLVDLAKKRLVTLSKLIGWIVKGRETQEKLGESEEKYRSLFMNLLEGYAFCKMVYDEKNRPVDFEYLEINDVFEKLTGVKRENLIGKSATETISGIEKIHAELFDIYSKVASTGKEDQIDLHFKPKDIWLSISVYSPKKGYFVAVFEDITVRKKTEKKLRESEEKYRNLVEMAPDSIMTFDLKGVITSCN